MKLKYKFVIRNVQGKPVAAAVGLDSQQFNGMIKLNDAGEVLFRLLGEGDISPEELLSRFAAHFGIPEETAKPAVLDFLEQLKKNGLLTD